MTEERIREVGAYRFGRYGSEYGMPIIPDDGLIPLEDFVLHQRLYMHKYARGNGGKINEKFEEK